MGIGVWTDCKDGMPKYDMMVVICVFEGYWRGGSNGGIVDLYTYKGEWFNVPDGVTIVQWMYDPDWTPERFEEILGDML